MAHLETPLANAFQRAMDLLDQRRAEDALPLLKELAKKDRDDIDSNMLLGIAEFRLHRFEDAERTFRRVIGLSPAHYKSVYYLGLALERQGKVSEAIEAYQTSLSLRPDFKEARVKLRLPPEPSARVGALKKIGNGRPDRTSVLARLSSSSPWIDTLKCDPSPRAQTAAALASQLNFSFTQESFRRLRLFLVILFVRIPISLGIISAVLAIMVWHLSQFGTPLLEEWEDIFVVALAVVLVLTVVTAVVTFLVPGFFRAAVRSRLRKVEFKDGRMIVDTGLLSRRVRSVELYRITNIVVKRAPVARTPILIITAPHEGYFYFPGIDEFDRLIKLADTLRELVVVLRSIPSVRPLETSR